MILPISSLLNLVTIAFPSYNFLLVQKKDHFKTWLEGVGECRAMKYCNLKTFAMIPRLEILAAFFKLPRDHLSLPHSLNNWKAIVFFQVTRLELDCGLPPLVLEVFISLLQEIRQPRFLDLLLDQNIWKQLWSIIIIMNKNEVLSSSLLYQSMQ